MCKLRHWKAQGSKERTRSANLESPAWSTRSSKCLSRVIPWKWIKQDFLGWDWLVGMIGLNQEAKELLFRASFPLYSKFFLERTESTSPLELEDVSRTSGLGRAWETSYATLPALTEGETQPPKHWSHQDSTQSLHLSGGLFAIIHSFGLLTKEDIPVFGGCGGRRLEWFFPNSVIFTSKPRRMKNTKQTQPLGQKEKASTSRWMLSPKSYWQLPTRPAAMQVGPAAWQAA